LKSGGDRPSCRRQYDGNISSNQYGIIATPNIGGNKKNTAHGGSLQTEITSGGPVSNKGECCAISIGVNDEDGTVYAATEDWEHSQVKGYKTYLCSDSPHDNKDQFGTIPPCTQKGASIAPGGVKGQIKLEWYVSHGDGHVYYDGWVGDQHVVHLTDPKALRTSGKVIDPARQSKNGARARSDGSMDTDMGRPYVISGGPPSNYYEGPEGDISSYEASLM
jgi:hypothetical protein